MIPGHKLLDLSNDNRRIAENELKLYKESNAAMTMDTLFKATQILQRHYVDEGKSVKDQIDTLLWPSDVS